MKVKRKKQNYDLIKQPLNNTRGVGLTLIDNRIYVTSLRAATCQSNTFLHKSRYPRLTKKVSKM